MLKNQLFLESTKRIREIIESYSFLIDVRTKKNDFTRSGKLGFKNIIGIILNFTKRSLQVELNDFFKSVLGSSDRVRKQAFSQGRQKISFDAFIILIKELVKVVYTATDLKMYKGYRLLAVDGSTMELQNTEELRKVFGYAENGKSEVARAKISGLYDIENDIIIDATIDHYKTPERALAIKHIENLKEYGLNNNLVIFDRGYPSREFMAYFMDNKINFLMRFSKSYMKELTTFEGNDATISFDYNGKKYNIRIIKVSLDDGTVEILATTIFDESFTAEDFKILYFKRWGKEVKYNELKHRLQIENLGGVKEIIVKQDFYAMILISNLIALAKMQSNEIIKDKDKEKGLKYEYKTNTNIAIGEFKNELISIIIEKNEQIRESKYTVLLQRISSYVTPIKPGRHNPRKFKVTRDRYPMNARRAL